MKRTRRISRRDDLGPGSNTRAEIVSQPELWPVAVGEGVAAEQLHRFLVSGSCLYIGCGSSAHLAEALAYRHRSSLSTAGWAQAASEFWLAPPSLHSRPDTVVAISRSGETTETIEACRVAQERGSTVCAITTVGDSALAALADEVVSLPFAVEESVVQTRSFASMLVAGVAAQIEASGSNARATLASLGNAASRMLDAAIKTSTALADPKWQTIHVLGSGFNLALAREGALKIKEMSRTNTDACPVLDFRHGPISVVDDAHAALIMCQDDPDRELVLATEIAERGAYVATIGPDPGCTIDLTEVSRDRDVRAIASLVVAQLSGLERGLVKGLNPDSPEGVVAYVEL